MSDIVERLKVTEADGRELPLHELRCEAAAEIGRLRGLLSDVQIIINSHNNIVANLHGEIKALRELLREGLDHHDEYSWQQRVREVLGE